MAYKIEPVIDIDINNLFFQLHQTALSETKKTYNGKINVVNLGVDYEKQTFVGAGDFIVLAQHNEKDTSLSPKTDPDGFFEECKNALCIYMNDFAGPDVVAKLKSNNKAFKRLDSTAPVPESIINKPLSDILLEKAEKSKTSGIGYYIEYNIDIPGQKKYQWYDIRDKFEKQLGKAAFSALKGITKAAASGLFGNMFSDLASLKMKIGGKDYNIGKPVANALKKVATGAKDFVIIAGKKFKKVFGKTDLEELDNNFTQELKSEFPNNTANSTIYKVDSLMIKLKKAKKFTSDIQNKLLENGKFWRMEYVITLQVSTADENYEQFSIDSLYKCFTNALKTTKSMTSLRDITTGAFNTFKKDNIIKIEDYSTALGVSKLKKQSKSIESIQIKQQFMKLMLEKCNIMLAEDTESEDAKDNIRSWLLTSDSPPQIDASRLGRIKKIIDSLTADEYKQKLKTATYKTKQKFVAALNSLDTDDKLNDLLNELETNGVLIDFYGILKKTVLKNTDDKDTSSGEQKDLYIFCLSNVIRQSDNKSEKKK